MRTVELEEWERRPLRLTTSERDDLARSRLVRLLPLGGDDYEAAAESIVGTFVGKGVRVLVRPKVELETIFFLLGRSVGLTTWRPPEVFEYASRPDLFGAMAHVLEAELARAERRGLVREYVDREEDLTTLRGRIDLVSQIRRHQSRPLPLACRFQEYELDHDLNRVLRAALTRVLGMPGLDSTLRQRLRSRLRSFIDVSEERYEPRSLPELRFTRLNRDWEPAARLAELILRRTSIVDRTGTVGAMSFSLDMNKLFEQFVEGVVRDEAAQRGWQLEPQGSRRLSQGIKMKPDLVLKKNGTDWGVADVKYKRVNPEGWPNADIYQLLAYCVGLDLPNGTLIYAEHNEQATEVVSSSRLDETELVMTQVSLEGSPEQILLRARRTANRLIDQADVVRRQATVRRADGLVAA